MTYPEILSIGSINLKDVILSGLDQFIFVNDLVRPKLGSCGQVLPNTWTVHVLLTDRFDKIVTTVICIESVTRRKLFLSLSLNDLFV